MRSFSKGFRAATSQFANTSLECHAFTATQLNIDDSLFLAGFWRVIKDLPRRNLIRVYSADRFDVPSFHFGSLCFRVYQEGVTPLGVFSCNASSPPRKEMVCFFSYSNENSRVPERKSEVVGWTHEYNLLGTRQEGSFPQLNIWSLSTLNLSWQIKIRKSL